MKKLLLLLPILVLRSTAFADDDYHSFVVSTEKEITVSGNRTMKIVNFVQESGGDARVKVTKAGETAIILAASLVDDKMSAEDKNMRIAGPAVVTVTAPAVGNAFITYLLVRD
ncbi:MAG: hypothetical protein ABJB69_09445 [Spartobacteria bacterium]